MKVQWWWWIVMWGILAGCGGMPAGALTPASPPATPTAFPRSPTLTVAPPPAFTATLTLTPSPAPTAQPDKWAWWTRGTRLRGANIYQRRVFLDLDGTTFLGPGPLGPPYTQADFDALAAQGANWVNLSVPGLFTVQPPYVPDPAVVAAVDRLLAMAARAHLWVVLSARTGPGRSEFSILREGVGDWFPRKYLIESVWRDAKARRAWAAMWRYTAARYRHNPIIVGYDLMVEPNANDVVGEWDSQAFMARYGGTGYDWNAWYLDLVTAIREVDPETPILIGCMGYSNIDWLATMQPVPARRVVYTVHQYAPFAYTHQEPGDIRPYPGRFDLDGDGQPETFDRRWVAAYLQTLADFREKAGAPVAVNEMGVKRWAPGAAIFMRDQMEALETLGVNYAVWMWYPSWSPLTEGDHDFNFRLGSDPAWRKDGPNSLWSVYQRIWQRNDTRP